MGNCEFRPQGHQEEDKHGNKLDSERVTSEQDKSTYISNKLVWYSFSFALKNN